MPSSGLQIQPEVREALAEGRPVVALESTIITFGLPWPRNLEVARELEATAREEGAVPATAAVIAGDPCLGLDEKALTLLAQGHEVIKAGERDLGLLAARRASGATTVSATLAIAARAGVRVFATGGMGGVHRDYHLHLDISQDLQALARYPLFLVSAGCKAILDIPNTLELLETLAVPVWGYRADRFPAFYTSRTSHPIERLEWAEEVAAAGLAHWAWGSPQGVLVANPIPRDVELPEHEVQAQVERALKSMKTNRIEGKARTPFLLKQLEELTGGESVTANIALIRNNVRIAARIARAVAQLQQRQRAVAV